MPSDTLIKSTGTTVSDSDAAPELVDTRVEMIETCGRLAQSLGFPRSIGEIYGLLYLATNPMGMEEIGRALSLSKASVSTGTRQLKALGAIRKVWRREDRKDYFEAVLDLGELARRVYDNIFKARMENADKRLDSLLSQLSADRRALDREEHAVIEARLKRLRKLQSRVKRLMPLVEKVFR